MESLVISTDVLLYILIGSIVILTIWIIHLEYKLKHFLGGKSAKTLEDTLLFVKEQLNKQVIVNQKTVSELNHVNAQLKTSIRGVGMIRFNPFKGTGVGGNQSFALAFLDNNQNGIILSSLYGRDRFSAFAKPITQGTSTFELTKEESQALLKAQETLTSSV
ncbi:DUF4446 family protein [Patescibacteria group bacterium]|nr:DUF4446 family protein [Patescibacteria group bacterium]MBU1519444.1 DUF4446 family protein [Patescibacteria group bacterium]MBU2010469.1 DUF4446 family protein [Patescibacteria group bacterium]MBU2416948.1 DUF4446 family protein [Patescibacteria group bacterium]MBU2460820.1 DUF4446 family protein [Patescibacteria group bacterium]